MEEFYVILHLVGSLFSLLVWKCLFHDEYGWNRPPVIIGALFLGWLDLLTIALCYFGDGMRKRGN